MELFLNALEPIGATPRMFLDRLRVGICLVDVRRGEIRFANSEFGRIVGRPVDDLVKDSTTFLEMTHPEDRERNALLQDRLREGALDHYHLEKRYMRPDGSVIWASVKVDAIERSAETTWSIGLIEDISDRKLLERQLDVVQSVAALTTWNWAVRSDTSVTSATYNALHGLPKATPAPSLNEAMERVHPDDRKQLRAAIKRALDRGVGYTEEYRVVRSDSEIRWVRTTATCICDAEGEVVNLIGATFDVTASKLRHVEKGVSKAMRDVLNHIEANLSQPISMKMLSELYGISPRSIHNHFAAQGTTPNTFVKQLRLRNARRKLLAADARTTVTAVALQCGFSNLGHFAKDYRKEYGEAPSDTMKSGSDDLPDA